VNPEGDRAALSDEAVGALRLALHVARDRPGVARKEGALGVLERAIAGQHVARARDGDQTSGDRRRPALRHVVAPQPGADHAHDDRAGVEADPHTEGNPVRAHDFRAERRQPGLDRQRGTQRAGGVVVVARGLLEQRHHAVAEELVDGAALGVDGVEDDLERAVEDIADVFGVEPLGHRGEAGDVTEKDGDVLAHAAARQRRTAGAAELLIARGALKAARATRRNGWFRRPPRWSRVPHLDPLDRPWPASGRGGIARAMPRLTR